MKFNVNDEVRVKLTSKGLAVLEKNHNDVFAPLDMLREYPFRKPETDAEGYSRFQLWVLMREFGPVTGNGLDVCFDTNIDIPLPKKFAADKGPPTIVKLNNGARELDLD